VPGVDPRSIVDSFNQVRGSGRHEATDIPAPRGTPVIAVADGVVKKLFTSVRGGLTVYQFDVTGTYCYYYAHLDRYAGGLREGQVLKRGDPLGYVGTTGDAPPGDPHLHFAIFKLGPDKHWWQGTPINPYPILTAAK
jgi:peptidoglycan LD-endopeptidase LytH